MLILDPLTTKYSAQLTKLGITSYWDLALHIPLRYEDLTQVYPIAELRNGQQAMVQGHIIGHKLSPSRQLLVRLDDGSAIITLLFFHFYPSYAQQYATGKHIRAYGVVKSDYQGNKTLFHPKVQVVVAEIKLSNNLSPIYPTTKGLTNAVLTKLLTQLLTAKLIPETLPESIRQRYQLLDLEPALLILHQLTPEQLARQDPAAALRRLKFDELIAQQLLMQQLYAQKERQPAPALATTQHYLSPFMSQLPFKLTAAQQRVTNEILSDLKQPQQMNRLLQGDVGSGKTIVAAIACLVALENNYQACLLAPTEILAEQHYLKLNAMLQPLAIQVVWLSGSLKAAQKRQAYAAIATGSAQLIIGTHAVFQKDVVFKALAIAVIDEQQRFGVAQRLALINKGLANCYPHQLLMSATPIPRSLAMSYYADLDVSSIDELPPGRSAIKTLLINNQRRTEVMQFIHSQAQLGQQCYWVCPLIEESSKLELKNALNTYAELTAQLAPLKVSLIHGKMPATAKATVMAEFSANLSQVLVATTVIEVGVDVPNATIMVIEHSERMGLAQLHQLRGRVGRGTSASQCILLYVPNPSAIAKARLKVINDSNDGFEIARQDLLLRGPGELLGERQSGIPTLRFANLEADLDIVEAARDIAAILEADYPAYAATLKKLWPPASSWTGV